MKFLITLIFLSGFISACAGGIHPVIGAPAWAMGGTSLCNADVWSTGNNQAAMAFADKAAAGIFVQNRFALPGTGYSNISVLLPVKHAAYGVNADYYGNGTYAESKLGLAAARLLNRKVSLGFAANYHRLSITGYGYTSAVTAEAGLMAKVSEKLELAFHIYNPLRARISRVSSERMPVQGRFGTAYKVSDQLKIAAELMLSDAAGTDFSSGLSYTVAQKLCLMLGLSTAKNQFSFGAGYLSASYVVHMSSSWHQYLGFSSQLSLTFYLSGKPKA